MKALAYSLCCAALVASALPAWADVSRDEAAAAAQRLGGGRVLSVEKSESGRRSAWRVKVVTPQGEVKVILIDAASGQLTSLGYQPSGGKTPRNFAIDPSGTYLLAANQDSGSIVTFRIDKATGKLSPAGPVTLLNQVVCLQFLEK